MPRITEWSEHIPQGQWDVYQQVIEEASRREIPFALGGAFAVATCTGHWRNTKDLDVYVLPERREEMIALLREMDFTDYFEIHSYDRWWIYRGTRDGNIVDVIWAMANHRAQIDDLWLSGPEVDVRGHRVKVLPLEALLWDKVYIMQRDRCDWPDLMNLLYAGGAEVDWGYLLSRMGEDAALMAGALMVFRWISPGGAARLPGWIWERLGLPPVEKAAGPRIDKHRVSLLDTRPWFGPDLEKRESAA
jgi:hypothetical protein